ncbi:cytochrome P450 [Kitasatospora sp. NPDC049285]|uniref:cytochrome P450 n=1 Tax=Kitasatospora sp. NPDC049285 TaxID=3157096 RepID=UPI003432C876
MTTPSHPTDRGVFPEPRGACPFAPAPAYEQAREQDPVRRVTLLDGSRPWMVTRHQDVRSVLADPRFSADAREPGFPFPFAARKFVLTGEPPFVRLDGAEHTRQRRMVTRHFTARRTEELRPKVQEITDRVVDAMLAAGDGADLITAFALPVPSLVICHLLGVPYEQHDFFQDRSRTLVDHSATPEQTAAGWTDLVGYLEELAEARLREPDDGIVSTLVNEEGQTPAQAAAMARVLLVGGHETSANMAALAVLALLRHPDQLAALRAEPALLPNAVEELLRYVTVVGDPGIPRVAVVDAEIGGQPIRAGEGVLCMLPVANRDPAVFTTPGALDLRADARRHVAFGVGAHQCLGMPLARLELQIMLGTLLRRLPGLRLAVPFEQLRYRERALIHGLVELPVMW